MLADRGYTVAGNCRKFGTFEEFRAKCTLGGHIQYRISLTPHQPLGARDPNQVYPTGDA
jgi:hypothetical protein